MSAAYQPAPYPSDEEARQGVVSRLLSCSFDMSELDLVVGEVARVFAVPMAAATVLDHDWQRFAAEVGLDLERTSRAVAFCDYTITHAKPFWVLDALRDDRFAGNPLVIRDPAIRFYAGARLMVGGMPVGSLCAIGRQPRAAIEPSQVDRLQGLAASASDILGRQFDRVPL